MIIIALIITTTTTTKNKKQKQKQKKRKIKNKNNNNNTNYSFCLLLSLFYYCLLNFTLQFVCRLNWCIVLCAEECSHVNVGRDGNEKHKTTLWDFCFGGSVDRVLLVSVLCDFLQWIFHSFHTINFNETCYFCRGVTGWTEI